VHPVPLLRAGEAEGLRVIEVVEEVEGEEAAVEEPRLRARTSHRGRGLKWVEPKGKKHPQILRRAKVEARK